MKDVMQSRHPGPVPHIQALLVGDSPPVRQGLALLFAPQGIQVSAEACGRAEALAHLERRPPDLAIVDLPLDGEDVPALIVDLRSLGIPVLVYSMHTDACRVARAITAGALGYVSKQEPLEVLIDAIREVAAGRRFVDSVAAAALAESLAASSGDDPVRLLSPHEQKVHELLGQGADTSDIAATLHISNHTVESYYERILAKLNINGMHHLKRHAIDHFQKHARQLAP